jgi:hypothetical protein
MKYGKFAGLHRDVMDRKARGPILLLAEGPDRISRADIYDALEVIAPMINRGVSLGFALKGKIVSKRDGRQALFDLLEPLIEWHGSHSDNETRRGRVLADVGNRRKAAVEEGDLYMDWVPVWLRVEMQLPDGSWVSVPKMGRGAKRLPGKRRAVVREDRGPTLRIIFELAASGMGPTRIVQWLNERLGEHPAWHGAHWQVDTINDLLVNEAVIGRWQSYTLEPHPEGGVTPGGKARKVRVPVEGAVRERYYEPAIPMDLWQRVQRARRQNAAKRTGRPSVRHVNLWTGMCRCGECGESMHVSGNDKRGYCLICRNAKASKCQNRTYYGLTRLERGFLDSGMEAVLDTSHFTQESTAEAEALAHKLEAARARVKDLEEQEGNVMAQSRFAKTDAARERIAKEVEKVMEEKVEAEKARGAIELQIEDLRANAEDDVLTRSVMLASSVADGDIAARGQLADALRSIFNRVDCFDGNIYLHLNRPGSPILQFLPGKGQPDRFANFKQVAQHTQRMAHEGHMPAWDAARVRDQEPAPAAAPKKPRAKKAAPAT